MKKIWCVFIMMTALMVMAGTAPASTILWYNGDFDGSANSLRSEHRYEDYGNYGIFQSDARVYDDFVVPAGGWTVNSVWTNNLFTSGVTVYGATYEIRSGVSAGDGGTVVASGTTDSFALTGTGRGTGGYTEYQLLISGLNISLNPGTYWLSVTPTIALADEYVYTSATSGLNAVGQPAGDNGNSYFYAYAHAANGQVTSNVNFREENTDFSMGVTGTSTVPIPSTMLLLGTGLLPLLGWSYRRKNYANS